MPAHRTQNSRHLRVEAAPPMGAPPINIISPTPRAFIFPATENDNANGDAPYSFTSQLHASHSLPNLFTFDSVSNNDADSSSWTDAQSSMGSHTSMFSSYTDSPSSYTASSFTSPSHSLHGSSYTPSPPHTSSTPPLSLSPSPSPQSHSSVDGDQLRSTSPVPYPHPLPPHSNGQVRTQPPRPPNPWICFRNVRSAQYKSTGEFPKLDKKGRGCSAPSSPSAGPIGLDGEARRPRQADLSKHISLEWKALTEEEKAPYVRMSEEAKIIHARVYPGYKYQPRRKLDAVDSAKKSVKTKKSGKKSSKSARRPAAAVEVGAHPAEQFDGAVGAGEIEIQLPALEMDIMPPGQDVNGGEQPKEWTWLPDQTLLPFTWDVDKDHSTTMDDVMNQLDANVDEGGEINEDLFQEPFYLSFPPLDLTAETIPEFLSFPESPQDFIPFADPSYNFPDFSALGLQECLPEDPSDMPQPLEFSVGSSSEPIMRRDSLANPYPDVSSDGNDEFGHVAGANHDPNAAQAQSSSAAQDHVASLPRLNASGSRPVRRGSVPAYVHSTFSDGLLHPPYVSPPRPHGRSRRSSVPTLASSSSSSSASSLDSQSDMRSIPMSNFGGNTGITTSILIPKTIPRFNVDLERDLADYSSAVGSMEPQNLAPADEKSTARPAALAGMESPIAAADEAAPLSPGFDFEAEFGDIIDIHASHGQST